MRILWIGALLAAVAGCAEEAPPVELPPRAIQWQRVATGSAAEQRVVAGIVTAVSETRLAFEVSGTVATVSVSLGERVERGQPLARLDPEPFELVVRDAEAALAEVEAARAVAVSDAARTQRLFDNRAASRQELERAIALRDARNGQVDAAKARLELARRDLRRSELAAPFTGVVAVRTIDPAMKVASGQTVFEMDSGESGLRVEVQMPETLIARVRQGDRSEVVFPAKSAGFDAGDRRFPAVVSEVGTRASVGNAFPVRADLVEAPEGLRPGMAAEVHFALQPSGDGLAELEGFLVPIAAARAEPDDAFSVFVFDPESSTVSRRAIRTGGIRDNEIAVLDGLAEGEIIATAGVSFLRDGQTVTLLDERLSPMAR